MHTEVFISISCAKYDQKRYIDIDIIYFLNISFSIGLAILTTYIIYNEVPIGYIWMCFYCINRYMKKRVGL